MSGFNGSTLMITGGTGSFWKYSFKAFFKN